MANLQPLNSFRGYLRRFESLRRLKNQINKGPKQNLGELLGTIGDLWKRARLTLVSAAKLETMRSRLPEKQYADGAMIAITFGSRQLGNRDNKLPVFLESFIEFTRCPHRVEILIKIDEDDDLPYFEGIKRKYSDRINLRIFPSPRGRGYEDMHIWHHQLIQKRNPCAKVNFILTDDAQFQVKNWDDQVAKLLEHRSNTYFIATACSLQEAISMHGPNPVKPEPIYWIRGDDYPIYGLDLLAAAAKAASQFSDWNEFGNLQLVDQYAGDLLRIAWTKHGVNLHEQIELYAARTGGNFCWSQSPKRSEIRTRTLSKFCSAESDMQRGLVVKQILSDMNTAI